MRGDLTLPKLFYIIADDVKKVKVVMSVVIFSKLNRMKKFENTQYSKNLYKKK